MKKRIIKLTLLSNIICFLASCDSTMKLQKEEAYVLEYRRINFENRQFLHENNFLSVIKLGSFDSTMIAGSEKVFLKINTLISAVQESDSDSSIKLLLLGENPEFVSERMKKAEAYKLKITLIEFNELSDEVVFDVSNKEVVWELVEFFKIPKNDILLRLEEG